jgi:hypothetical protein
LPIEIHRDARKRKNPIAFTWSGLSSPLSRSSRRESKRNQDPPHGDLLPSSVFRPRDIGSKSATVFLSLAKKTTRHPFSGVAREKAKENDASSVQRRSSQK